VSVLNVDDVDDVDDLLLVQCTRRESRRVEASVARLAPWWGACRCVGSGGVADKHTSKRIAKAR
jgi:hypothetical protein